MYLNVKKYAAVLVIFFISFFCFLAIPSVGNHAYAIDICGKNGYFPRCEDPGSLDKRWILYPDLNEPCFYGGAFFDCDVCSYHKDGESRECPSGTVCQGGGPDKGESNKPPKCVPVPKTDITNCTCTHNNSKEKEKNGWTCDIKGKKVKDFKYCETSQICSNGTNGEPPTCKNMDCSCDEASGKGRKMTCAGGKTPECSKEEVCVGQKKNATCVNKVGVCTCENPGVEGGGKNGYKCKRPDGTEKSGNCIDAKEACQTDKSKGDPAHPGIICNKDSIDASDGTVNNPVDYDDEALNNPPKPPCTSTGGKGQCLGVETAFGLFNTDPGAFVTNVFAILLSSSGGVGVLLLIRAGYRIMISQGKPEQLQQGRDDLIAAIVGLLFLIFSFVILQVIGVDILNLPGFK